MPAIVTKVETAIAVIEEDIPRDIQSVRIRRGMTTHPRQSH